MRKIVNGALITVFFAGMLAYVAYTNSTRHPRGCFDGPTALPWLKMCAN